jgi:indole-3-glycerol phosphate synthase
MAHARIDYRLPEELRGSMLETIMNDRLHDLIGAKLKWPEASIESALDRAPAVRSLKNAIRRRSPAVIAEIKKASPSAGILRADFDPVSIGREYQKAGAAAVSVVTEGKHFRGNLETIPTLRWTLDIPLLCKDFIVDRFQILTARHAGADAVLLIASLLDSATLKRLKIEAERLGMEVLVEVHNQTELERALGVDATLIGVNNRDLRSFQVSLDVSLRLGPHIPEGVVALSESGIRSTEDMRRLSDAGFRGFLIGETFMRAPSPGAALHSLLSGLVPARRNVS